MTSDSSVKQDAGEGLGRLLDLPVIPATSEPSRRRPEVCRQETVNEGAAAATPFASEREYRYCKAVIDQPGQPSSRYPKLAGISTATAQAIRRKLVAAGLIRQQTANANGGRSPVLLEILPAGQAAVAAYESRSEVTP